MNWTTTAVKESWKSPDGKVTIWEVKNSDGKLEQTMSQAIATHGWSGQIEAYTNDNNKRYIRQEKKEEFKKGDSEGMAWGNALTNAVNLHLGLGFTTGIGKEQEGLLEIRTRIIGTAKFFYDNRPSNSEQPAAPEVPSRDINEDLENTIIKETEYIAPSEELDSGYLEALAKDGE